MRKFLQITIGFCIAAVCLYYVFRGISIRDLLVSLRQASLPLISLALCLYFIGYLIRALRWAILIKPVQSIPAYQLLWVMLIGYFANNVLPLRMGELVRAHVCGTKFHISRTASLGTILLERLCDTLSFLITFLLASIVSPFPTYMKNGALLLGGACILVIVGLLLLNSYEPQFRKLLDGFPMPASWRTKFHHLITHFVHSTAGILRPRFVIEAMSLSLVIWTIEGTFLFLISHALNVPLAYAGAFFLLFGLGLSVTLPQAPGYVGTFELFGTTALTLLGIPKAQALSVILTVHGLQFGFITLLGIMALWMEGLGFRSLLDV